MEEKTCPDFVKPTKRACPTKFLFVSNANTDSETIQLDLMNLFQQFGEFDETFGPIFISKEKHLCYICYKDKLSTQAAVEYSHENNLFVDGRKVSVRYADLSRVIIPPPEPECISETEDIVVPGLHLFTEFVSLEEEKELLEFSDQKDDNGRQFWKTNLHRRVQHFGYEFNYSTLLLDRTANIRPVPPQVMTLMRSKLTDLGCFEEEASCVNQLTINEYYPGQGISSHVDAESCFGSFILILSLGSDIVMTLTELDTEASLTPRPQLLEREEKNDVAMEETKSEASATRRNFGPTKPQPGGEQRKKHVYLPSRSLLVLTGPSRYQWAHHIAMRKMDKINGVLQKRSRRISFTFREGLVPPELRGEVVSSASSSKESLPRVSPEKSHLSGDAMNEILSQSTGIQSTEIEKKHVYEVYDEIAMHWHHTRGKRKVYWNRVKLFLESLPRGSLVADIGCGDGKYFGVNPEIFSIGCDRSPVLLEVSAEKSNETFCCDAVKLPFRSDSFDATICIAVLHHLASEDRRLAVISEMVRIMRPGGRAMLQAWALEQEDTSRRKFHEQNVLVPWQLQQHFSLKSQPGGDSPASTSAAAEKGDMDGSPALHKTAAAAGGSTHQVTYQRFCHVYREGELENLLGRVPHCRLIESGYDRSNWFICFEKLTQ